MGGNCLYNACSLLFTESENLLQELCSADLYIYSVLIKSSSFYIHAENESIECSGGPWVFALGIHKGRGGDDVSRGLASGKNSKTMPSRKSENAPYFEN